MKTINDLVGEHRPFRTMDKILPYLLKWAALSFLVFGIAYAFFPLNPNLSVIAKEPIFHLEILLWLALSLSSGLALYDYSFPDNRRQLYGYLSVYLFSTLLLLSFYHSGFAISLQDANEEMSLWKGRCGFIIFFLALIENFGMLWWAKRGASSTPRTAALWAALSSSALACLLMQIVCLHNTTFHLLIWHFIPLSLFCYLAQRIFAKKLAW